MIHKESFWNALYNNDVLELNKIVMTFRLSQQQQHHSLHPTDIANKISSYLLDNQTTSSSDTNTLLILNTTNHEGCTALNEAIMCGYFTLTHVLLDLGADATIATDTGFTPLMHAVISVTSEKIEKYGAIQDRYDVFKRILMCPEVVQQINYQNIFGNTALHYAATYQNSTQLDVVDLLLREGSNNHIQNNVGETAENIARCSNNHILADYIINYEMTPS